MNDCLLLVHFFVVLFACCSDRDESVATVKKMISRFSGSRADTSDSDPGTSDVTCSGPQSSLFLSDVRKSSAKSGQVLVTDSSSTKAVSLRRTRC